MATLTDDMTVVIQFQQQSVTVGRRLAAIIQRMLLAQEDIERASQVTVHCGRREDEVKLEVLKRY